METQLYGFINVTFISYALTNYGFIIWTENGEDCIIVDPGHVAPIQSFLSLHQLTPGSILVTHKQHDHSYGVKEMHLLYPEAQIVSSTFDRVNDATLLISTNQKKEINFDF